MRKGADKGCKRRVQIYKCSENIDSNIFKIWSFIIISTHNVYLKCYLIFYFCFCLWHLPLTRNHLRPWNWSQVVVTLSVHTIYTITIHKVFFLKPNMHAVSMKIVKFRLSIIKSSYEFKFNFEYNIILANLSYGQIWLEVGKQIER